jgi:hypothetical protein
LEQGTGAGRLVPHHRVAARREAVHVQRSLSSLVEVPTRVVFSFNSIDSWIDFICCSVPMAPATYWIPAASIHSFLMFAPFFVMKKNMVIQGIFLWLAGPFLASYITPNLMEQASIWCFFSIAQIGIMVNASKKNHQTTIVSHLLSFTNHFAKHNQYH